MGDAAGQALKRRFSAGWCHHQNSFGYGLVGLHLRIALSFSTINVLLKIMCELNLYELHLFRVIISHLPYVFCGSLDYHLSS